jgi:YgiT-type zinc finger domain-containing protein
MDCRSIFFSGHAIRRMFERSIGRSKVTEVVRFGDVIDDYPDDEPFPSFLIFGFVGNRPLHVVVAVETESKNKEKPMRCILCKQGNTKSGMVTVTLERGDTIVIIKGVPAQVCENCGEYYLNDEITERVLSMAEEAAKKNVEVEILRFAA